jgi:uncharacterized membrane protein
MTKGRMEAFSDGVIAIIITIMVLELKVPHSTELSSLIPLLPVFLSYAMSFVYIGIYWNNHHHLIQAVKHINGKVLWANLHLLFWLSLTPFVTAWMGENNFAPVPVALYGLVLLLAGVSYYILVRVLISLHGSGSLIERALGADIKGKISIVIYTGAIVLSFFQPLVSCAIYAIVVIMWLVPDKRIENILGSNS